MACSFVPMSAVPNFPKASCLGDIVCYSVSHNFYNDTNYPNRFEELLLGFNLIHEGQLLNAAVVLFGRADCFLPFYPQCSVRMARFRGLDKLESAYR